MDDLDSTFRFRAPLAPVAGVGISFENDVEFPGYFLSVAAPQPGSAGNYSVMLVQSDGSAAYNASATWIAHAGLAGAGAGGALAACS
jgi:hypothetical protein